MKRVGSDERAKQESLWDSSGVRTSDTTSQAKFYERIESQADQIRFEFTNFHSIVMRKNGMFYKAMGNSAILLKSLGAKTKLRTGYDPMTKQEILELSIHESGLQATKDFLKTKCGEVLRDDKALFVIRLKQPMDAKKLKYIKSSDAVKIEVTEDILTKRRQETPLAKEVRDLFEEASYLTRSLKGVEGEVFGRLLLELVLRLQLKVRELIRDEASPVRRQAVEDAADDIQGLLLVLPNYAQQADRLARMGRSLNRIITRKKKEEKG